MHTDVCYDLTIVRRCAREFASQIIRYAHGSCFTTLFLYNDFISWKLTIIWEPKNIADVLKALLLRACECER